MRVRLGISSCLLGEEVRFNGGHKRDRFLTDTLGRFVEWVPVCPEVEVGMGVPRPSVRLVGATDTPRLVCPSNGKDWTEPMQAWSAQRLEQLAGARLHGFVLKKNSPTCGLLRVLIYPAKGEGAPRREGTGVFARALRERLPLLPVEEEGRLHDMPLRENFIARIFGYARLRALLEDEPRPRDLVDFHTAHKLTLLSHSPARYRDLGRLVADQAERPFPETLDRYAAGFMGALAVKATPGKHTDVLLHLVGFLKRALDRGDRAELVRSVEDYRKGLVPLVVPLTLLKHHFRRHPQPWVEAQTYLAPYPEELLLRNHV